MKIWILSYGKEYEIFKYISVTCSLTPAIFHIILLYTTTTIVYFWDWHYHASMAWPMNQLQLIFLCPPEISEKEVLAQSVHL
jgi:hypothetical protein